MTFSDVTLLVKKIVVGFLLVLIPFFILWGGIKLTIKLLTPAEQKTGVIVNGR